MDLLVPTHELISHTTTATLRMSGDELAFLYCAKCGKIVDPRATPQFACSSGHFVCNTGLCAALSDLCPRVGCVGERIEECTSMNAVATRTAVFYHSRLVRTCEWCGFLCLDDVTMQLHTLLACRDRPFPHNPGSRQAGLSKVRKAPDNRHTFAAEMHMQTADDDYVWIQADYTTNSLRLLCATAPVCVVIGSEDNRKWWICVWGCFDATEYAFNSLPKEGDTVLAIARSIFVPVPPNPRDLVVEAGQCRAAMLQWRNSAGKACMDGCHRWIKALLLGPAASSNWSIVDASSFAPTVTAIATRRPVARDTSPHGDMFDIFCTIERIVRPSAPPGGLVFMMQANYPHWCEFFFAVPNGSLDESVASVVCPCCWARTTLYEFGRHINVAEKDILMHALRYDPATNHILAKPIGRPCAIRMWAMELSFEMQPAGYRARSELWPMETAKSVVPSGTQSRSVRTLFGVTINIGGRPRLACIYLFNIPFACFCGICGQQLESPSLHVIATHFMLSMAVVSTMRPMLTSTDRPFTRVSMSKYTTPDVSGELLFTTSSSTLEELLKQYTAEHIVREKHSKEFS